MSIPPYSLVETAPPEAEPVSLDEAKLHLRVDHDDDDDLIEALIATARQICENTTGLALIGRDYSLFLDAWPVEAHGEWWDGVREGADTFSTPAELALPRPPLAAITALKTYDTADAATTFAASGYFVDLGAMPGRIVLKDGITPPEGTRVANAIEIQFTAGYGDAAEDVPAVLRQGIKQIVAHLYENRGDSAEDALTRSGALALFQPFRRMTLS